MTPLDEKTLSSEPVYLGKLVKLFVETVELPDGNRSMREIVKHPGAVAMVPLLASGEVVLVRQFRGAADRVLLEIPAGTLEAGEEPLAAAGRELQEEAGYRPGKLERLGGEYTAPGYTSEFIHLFLATDLVPSRLVQDADEFLEVVTLPLDEALRQVENGEIQDGKTIIGLLLVARRMGR
jgi:ADP-ribose pyrophosphatase